MVAIQNGTLFEDVRLVEVRRGPSELLIEASFVNTVGNKGSRVSIDSSECVDGSGATSDVTRKAVGSAGASTTVHANHVSLILS